MSSGANLGQLKNDAYYQSYGLAEDSLIAEREYFKSVASNFSLTPAERAGAVAVAAGINSKLLVLQAQFDAFVAKYEGPGVNPPSQAMLQRSSDLSAALAKDLKAAVAGTAVLSIVNDFFKKWTSLLQPAAPAAVPTSPPPPSGGG